MRVWKFPGWAGGSQRLPVGGSEACARCGAGGALSPASITPFHKGGRGGPRNRQWLCRECLRLKRAEDR